MGKGDKRTKKGKIYRGTYGKSRNKKNHHAEGGDANSGPKQED
jgi:ribosomal small subunit protein bTHX